MERTGMHTYKVKRADAPRRGNKIIVINSDHLKPRSPEPDDDGDSLDDPPHHQHSPDSQDSEADTEPPSDDDQESHRMLPETASRPQRSRRPPARYGASTVQLTAADALDMWAAAAIRFQVGDRLLSLDEYIGRRDRITLKELFDIRQRMQRDPNNQDHNLAAWVTHFFPPPPAHPAPAHPAPQQPHPQPFLPPRPPPQPLVPRLDLQLPASPNNSQPSPMQVDTPPPQPLQPQLQGPTTHDMPGLGTRQPTNTPPRQPQAPQPPERPSKVRQRPENRQLRVPSPHQRLADHKDLEKQDMASRRSLSRERRRHLSAEAEVPKQPPAGRSPKLPSPQQRLQAAKEHQEQERERRRSQSREAHRRLFEPSKVEWPEAKQHVPLPIPPPSQPVQRQPSNSSSSSGNSSNTGPPPAKVREATTYKLKADGALPDPPRQGQAYQIPRPPALFNPITTLVRENLDAHAQYYNMQHYDYLFSKAWRQYKARAKANMPQLAKAEDGGKTYMGLHAALFRQANPALPPTNYPSYPPSRALAWHLKHANDGHKTQTYHRPPPQYTISDDRGLANHFAGRAAEYRSHKEIRRLYGYL